MIKFKKIRFQNFLSYGNEWTEVALDKHKTTLVLGANAAGKTSKIDALVFALYGRSFRKKLKKPQLINSITQKNMLVEVEFTTNSRDYLVRRGMKPNVFDIYENGELIPQDAANKDYQAYLEENILKINHRAFGQIVALGSANYTPFMELTTNDRRMVIEDLLDIEIFSVMNTILKEKIVSNKEELRDIETRLSIVQSKIDMSRDHVQQLIDNNVEQIKLKKEYYTELHNENATITEKISELEEKAKTLSISHEAMSKAIKARNDLRSYRTTLTNRRTQTDKQIGFYETKDDCPTCKQSITEDFKKSQIEAHTCTLAELNKALDEIDAELDNLDASIIQMEGVKTVIDGYAVEKAKLETQFRYNTSMMEQYEAEIEQLQTKNIELSGAGEIDPQYINQKKELEAQKDKILTHREVYGIATTLLKDDGIKAQIIKQYIPVMNQIINKYLAAMDFFIKFEIDENFNERILSRHRDEHSYYSMSQGEKFRIDIAILFAWREIARMRSSTSTNLLVMDEILDGSVDAEGIEDFMKIINDLGDDSNVFVVSHRQEQMIDMFNSVIRVEKKSNFSQMRFQ